MTRALRWAARVSAALAPLSLLRTDPDERRARLGLDVPPVEIGGVWIHAASVGEGAAAARLARALDGPVLITLDTRAGVASTRRRVLGQGARVQVARRPIEHPWALASWWAEVRPRLLVLVEGVFWPGLVSAARDAGVPVARVSARVGRRTALACAAGWPAHAVDLSIARSPLDEAYLRRLGGTVVAGGDLKGGIPPRSSSCFAVPHVVGASTRDGDERALLTAWAALPVPTLLVLAPRQRERVAEVVVLAAARGVAVRLWSELGHADPNAAGPRVGEVVVVDTHGDLAGLLVGASAAFIGGTFDRRVGGHSPLEALSAGVPVVHGPHTWANAAAFGDGCRVVADPCALPKALAVAVAGPRPRPLANVVADTVAALGPLLAAPVAAEAPRRPWLAPAVGVWQAVGAWRRRSPGRRLDAEVWAVGSVDPRGSGKTTAARALAARLVAEGRRVGVVVRGYGRPSGGLGLSWALRPGNARAAAWTLGDEGALFADDGLLVAAGDRAEAGAALVGAGCDTIVVDDGLPTRGILADHRVAVIDGRRPLAGGLQPAGDARVVGPLPGDVDEAWVLYASNALNLAVPWRAARREVLPWRGVAPREAEPLFAFAGIGRPASFFAGLGPALTGWRALHDHDPLSDETLRRIQEEAAGRAIVCTAKDAVRLPDRWRARVGWRDVQLTLGPTMGEGR